MGSGEGLLTGGNQCSSDRKKFGIVDIVSLTMLAAAAKNESSGGVSCFEVEVLVTAGASACLSLTTFFAGEEVSQDL